jgi:hypothetical protein
MKLTLCNNSTHPTYKPNHPSTHYCISMTHIPFHFPFVVWLLQRESNSIQKAKHRECKECHHISAAVDGGGE